MEHFYNKPHMGENWFTFPLLYSEMVKRFSSESHFVEIGSWKGMSAAYMAVEIANSDKDIKFDCVDIWAMHEGSDIEIKGDTLYETFLNNIAPVKHIINPIRKDSSLTAEDYQDNSIDFVFIDGDHSYEGCKKDILAWKSKIKENGVLAGHDYAWHEPVRRAVADVFGPGNFGDPWGCGCFIFEKIDGKFVPFKGDESTKEKFVYNVRL